MLQKWGSYLIKSISQPFPTGNEEASYRQTQGSQTRMPKVLNAKLLLPKDLETFWEKDVKSCLAFQRKASPFHFPFRFV